TYSILTMMSEDGSQLWNIDFSYWQVPGDCLLARPLYCDDSNIYLNATCDISNLPNQTVQPGFVNYRNALLKTDLAGQIEWTSIFGIEVYLSTQNLQIINNFIFSPVSLGDDILHPLAGVASFDNDGSFRWVKQFSCFPNDCDIISLSSFLDHNQNIWIGGTTDGPLPGKDFNGNLDMFLIQYHPNSF
ncbi:hypothetical protein KKF34_06960, partial [Myxococcota bacterium]|nr:hypothetical protein [Myxococcota bacterium]MBU1382942.1 hypothetical protein [Myxococcota bacterium]MBU1496601.1 hypothetical protein [Myxococcota bacterium]